MRDEHISSLEITRGGAQILEALQCTVSGVSNATNKRRIHLDIGPHTIFLTMDGQWRLGGWGFSLELNTNEASTPCPYFLSGSKFDSGGAHAPVGPRLAYASPELTNAAVPGGEPAGLTIAADVFSLALVLAEGFKGPAGSEAGSSAASIPLLSAVNEKSPFTHRAAIVQFLSASSLQVSFSRSINSRSYFLFEVDFST